MPTQVSRRRPLLSKQRWLLSPVAVEAGLTQLIVAGGETSGRIVADLGISQLTIGPQISPGLAWAAATTSRGRDLNLALKSGNFGDPSLFITGWESLA
jgi:uncharacterized protein YgbK (DUF1537 family)